MAPPTPSTHLRPTSLSAVDDSHTGFLSFPFNTSCSLSTLGESHFTTDMPEALPRSDMLPGLETHAEADGFPQEEVLTARAPLPSSC